jgi:hypothetical protein
MITSYFTWSVLKSRQEDGHRPTSNAGFEVLAAVIMKMSVFWGITLNSTLKVNRRFGEKFCPFLKGRNISQHEEPDYCLLHFVFLLGSFFEPKDGRQRFSETLADFLRTIWRYALGDRTLQCLRWIRKSISRNYVSRKFAVRQTLVRVWVVQFWIVLNTRVTDLQHIRATVALGVAAPLTIFDHICFCSSIFSH